MANIEFTKRKQIFYDIHSFALDILKNNINLDLKELQQILKDKFQLNEYNTPRNLNKFF